MDSLGKKFHRLYQPFIGFCAAKTQKTMPGISKTLTAKASHALIIAGTFQQIHGQPMGCYAQLFANGRNIRKDIKSARWHENLYTRNLFQMANQQLHLLLGYALTHLQIR